MAAAILVITLGGIMVYSALKGTSIVDAARGATGDTLNPHGHARDTSTAPPVAGPTNSLGFPAKSPAYQLTGTATAQGGPQGHFTFAGPKAALLALLMTVAQQQFHLTITATTNGVHVTDSYHYRRRAFDASGRPADMAAYWQFVHDTYGSQVAELFYDPKGAIKNGHPIPAIGGHTDHVHTAA